MLKEREIITLATCILTLCLPLTCKNEKRATTTKTPIKVQVQTVKNQMGGQPRQSDVFREIAKQWKEMSEEEKRPFIEEV